MSAFNLVINLQDSSLPSLISGLKEILNKIEHDEEKIQDGIEFNYESEYNEEKNSGKYLAIIKFD